jgi:hypothetical protein
MSKSASDLYERAVQKGREKLNTSAAAENSGQSALGDFA